MSVLWSKVQRDLFQNWARSITIILTITLGVFALGVVINLYVILNTKMKESLQLSNPSHIHVPVALGFNQTQARRLERIPGVAAVEAVTISRIRWKKTGDAEWSSGMLIARDSYTNQVMDLITLDAGSWPGKREAGVERLTAQYFDIRLGSNILIRTGENSQKAIPLTSIIHSIQAVSPRLLGGEAIFYVTRSTLKDLTGIAQPNMMNVQLTHFEFYAARRIATEIKDQLNLSVSADIADPAKPAHQEQMQAFSIVLAVLGVGILGLSILLIVNVFNAIMLQQVRQIGSMKTIGAGTGQIMRIYLSISLAYGALSVLLALPLATLAAHRLSSGLLLSFLNIDPPPLQIIPLAWGGQAIVGLFVPILAALFPVLNGARITIRQAIQNYGVSALFRHSWLEKALLNLQGVSVAWTISARNVLRSKQRSVLALAMMTIGGLLFISVMSVKGSFHSTLLEMASVFHYDVEIDFSTPQRVEGIRRMAEKIPQVGHVEMFWTGESAFSFGGTNERMLVLYALPPDSQIYIPKIVAGRWLETNDTQTIVLNSKIAEEEGIRVGDFISMTSTKKPIQWQVVGLIFDTNNRQRTAFVPLRSFARIKKQNGFATDLMIQTTDHNDETQNAVEKALVDLYEKHNLPLSGSTTFHLMLAQNLSQFDILTYLLLAMTILTALVGGLGLMGSMFLNVAERRREIGVMRAIGGDSKAIAQIFVNEGTMVGLLSWLISAALSAPASDAFARAIGIALFGLPLNPSLSWTGIWMWLLIVLGLSALASAWPAWQAARVSVRDSLVYE